MSPDISAPPRLAFSLPLDAARLSRARQRIRDYLVAHGVAPVVVDDVVLAIEEAMSNAVRHSGTHEELQVSLAFDGVDLIAEVRDRGRGFDPASLGFDPDRVDTRHPPDPLRPGGRGLFLMACLSDAMDLRCDGGVRVRMRKRRALPAQMDGGAPDSGILDAARLGAPGYRALHALSLVEEMGEGFLAIDWEYRVCYANTAALDLYHVAWEDVVGKTAWEIFPLLERIPMGTSIREAMELGRPAIVEFLSPTLGRWLESRIYPTTTGVSFYVRDIHERKIKEQQREELMQALRESEEQLLRKEAQAQHLLRYAPAAIYEIDFRGPRFTSVNDFMCTYSGYPREELLHMNPFDLLDEEGQLRLRERIAASLSGAPMQPEIEYRFRTKTGDVRRAVLNVTPKYTGGRAVGAFVVAHDVTERKRAEDALRESEERYRWLFGTLRRSLLHPLPMIDGFDLAELSLPAHRPELIGGDFFDVFQVAGGQIVALTGDVMGKGVEAAGLTETVRAAVRALALVSPAPHFIMEHANQVLLIEEHQQFVSLAIATLDPRTGRGQVASAGHPAIVHVSGSGAALVEPEYGLLLGCQESEYRSTEFVLRPDEAIVFYTDGVTEARGRLGLFGERRLLETLGAAVRDAAAGVAAAGAAAAGVTAAGAAGRSPGVAGRGLGAAARSPVAAERSSVASAAGGSSIVAVPDPHLLVERLREAVLAHCGELRDDLQILALRRRS